MHELSIASSILDTVRAETSREGLRAVQVGLRIGALSGVDPEALAFGFEALVKDSDLDGLSLEIERVAHRRRCPACAREFEAGEFDVSCPGCGDLRTEMQSGDELEIAYLEVDDR